MTATEIRAKIESEVPGARAEVRDYTGTGDHFQVRVVAPSFEGRTLVERHQMLKYGPQCHRIADSHAQIRG